MKSGRFGLGTSISRYIWESRYRWVQDGTVMETSIDETWLRVARAAAAMEDKDQDFWLGQFLGVLRNFCFVPGGRILAGAGTGRNVTLFNCFVMGIIKDDMAGIFDGLKEGALTMQAGGGVGYDFSTLRPRGCVARSSGNIASGPVSYMHVWNAMCETLLSTGARRGAMIASLRCDHPDIELFIDAKRRQGELNHFNLSLQISDDFVRAAKRNEDWPLVFPLASIGGSDEREIVMRPWPGLAGPVPCAVLARRPAAELWQRIMKSNYATAEPGVLFIDRVNAMNNLAWREHISCTNPCGEIPLPPYGACNLGSLNLTRFVRNPFTSQASFDLAAIRETASVATRFLDNIIDASRFPLEQQAEQARGSRRIGLGITGLADALIMAGLHYDSDAARQQAAAIMATVCHAAYRCSMNLASEKGTFPFLDRQAFLRSRFLQSLPEDIVRQIASKGIRNSHLTAIAPAGTISLLAGNVSSGIEPVFEFELIRQVLDRQGHYQAFELEDYAHRLWLDQGHAVQNLPEPFVTAQLLSPRSQLLMQSALQPFVDNAISKTVTVPHDYPFEAFQDLYLFAWELGLKGCTTFRPGARRGEVLGPRTDVDLSSKVAFLRQPSAYAENPARVEVIQTHMSWVFLTERFVYKMKKPVRLDFLDFSTLERRRLNCMEELRLNRRLAADIYLEVIALTVGDSGDLELGGEGETVDWLVKMRRLPRDSMLDRVIARRQVDDSRVREVARVLTDFYRQAKPERLTTDEYLRQFEQDIQANDKALSEPEYSLPGKKVSMISKALRHYLSRERGVFDARVKAHRIIEAHGDLRPEHICLTDPPVIIDCLEFNRRLRVLDVADELAFLAMECEHAGAPFIGPVLFEAYRQFSGDDPPVLLVSFYQAYRAQMRAKLSIWHLMDCDYRDRDKWIGHAKAYLGLAARFAKALHH